MEAGEGAARLGGWAMAYDEDGGGVHAGTGSGGSYAPLGERLFVWFVVAMIMLAIGASVIQLNRRDFGARTRMARFRDDPLT